MFCTYTVILSQYQTNNNRNREHIISLFKNLCMHRGLHQNTVKFVTNLCKMLIFAMHNMVRAYIYIFVFIIFLVLYEDISFLFLNHFLFPFLCMFYFIQPYFIIYFVQFSCSFSSCFNLAHFFFFFFFFLIEKKLL
jgi:hypothetical protein